MENDTSCPTCRQSLASDLQPEQEEQRQPRGMAAFMMGRGLRRNHFFHFDGTNLDHIYLFFPSEIAKSNIVLNERNVCQREPCLDGRAGGFHQVEK